MTMDTTTIIIYLVFTIVVIWHSHQIWIDPNKFIKRMRRIRFVLHRYSLGLLLPKSVMEGFNDNPEFEILLAKIMFIIIYIAIIFIALFSNL